MRAWGDQGVLLLLADSTNAEQEGQTPSERNVETMLERAFSKAEGRVLLATFASNLGRAQQIINVARRHNRRRCGGPLYGQQRQDRHPVRLPGYYSGWLLTTTEMESLPPNEVVIVATGSQGEADQRDGTHEHR